MYFFYSRVIDPLKMVKGSSQKILVAGQICRITGIKARPELNNTFGKIISWVPKSQRFRVLRLGNFKDTNLLVKNLNLEIVVWNEQGQPIFGADQTLATDTSIESMQKDEVVLTSTFFNLQYIGWWYSSKLLWIQTQASSQESIQPEESGRSVRIRRTCKLSS